MIQFEVLVDDLVNLNNKRSNFIGKFKGRWGAKGSERYDAKRMRFLDALVVLSRECGVKPYNGNFYYFNGEIYERVDPKTLKMAYFELMHRLRLVDMNYRDETAYKTFFLDRLSQMEPLKLTKHCIAFKNGVFDMHEALRGERDCLHKFSRDYVVISQLPYDYDPDAKCLKFEKALQELLPDADSREDLQMILGETLLPHNEFQDVHFGYLTGPGGNGKSTITDYVEAILGEDNCIHKTIDQLVEKGLNGTVHLKDLDGKKACIIDETNPKEFGKYGTALIKAVSGHSTQSVRALYGDTYQMRDIPILIVNANGAPVNPEKTHAFERRFAQIDFTVIIPPEKQNHGLKAELISEELAGGFNWLLQGARRVLERNFVFHCDERRESAKKYSQLIADPIGYWMKEIDLCSTAIADGEQPRYISSNTLRGYFNRYISSYNLPEYNERTFGLKLKKEHDFASMKRNGIIQYACYGSFELT